MPKSKVRPAAAAKKKAASKFKLADKARSTAEVGNPGGKTYYANSLAGAVKLGSGGVKRTAFHNRKGGGE